MYPIEGEIRAADGTPIWYGVFGNREGSGVPIVCANGIGCSIYFWKYISRYFGKNAPVVLWDYRGHGKSGHPRNRKVSIAQCVEDMHQVMDAAGISKAVLVGHSMGSQVILEFYRRHAEQVAALVPLLGAFGKPLDTFFDSKIPRRVFPFLYNGATKIPGILSWISKKTVNPEMGFFLGHRLGIINGYMANMDDMRAYFSHIPQVPVDIFFHLAKDMSEHTCDDMLEEIRVPVLVIGGERDKFTPLWLSREMASRIPAAELLVIREGSHAAIIEQPDLINLRLEKFIADRVADPASAG